MASAESNPSTYTARPTRRIIIKEKTGAKSSKNGPLPPTSSREIVIVEKNGVQENELSTGSSENPAFDGMLPPTNQQDNLVIIEKSGQTTPHPPESESGTRPKSSAPRDPAEPQSHTVLQRSTSPHKVTKSKSNTLSPPPAAVKQEVKTPLRSKSTDEIAAADSKEEDNLIQRAKKGLVAATAPRVHGVLPEGCKPKYERYTYLPGVKPIPLSTPSWKVPILQGKNKQVIDAFLDKMEIEKIQREKERREREKIEAVPEWKRPVMKAIELRKVEEQKKKLELAQKETKEWEQFKSLPPWRQELVLRKKEKERVEGLPSWQRELILKKRVANMKNKFSLRNSDDVREDGSPVWTQMTLRKTQPS